MSKDRDPGWYWAMTGSMGATYPWEILYWDGSHWMANGLAGKIPSTSFSGKIDERPIVREEPKTENE